MQRIGTGPDTAYTRTQKSVYFQKKKTFLIPIYFYYTLDSFFFSLFFIKPERMIDAFHTTYRHLAWPNTLSNIFQVIKIINNLIVRHLTMSEFINIVQNI